MVVSSFVCMHVCTFLRGYAHCVVLSCFMYIFLLLFLCVLHTTETVGSRRSFFFLCNILVKFLFLFLFVSFNFVEIAAINVLSCLAVVFIRQTFCLVYCICKIRKSCLV